MGYELRFATWEITNACNMRCMHCGSSSGEPLPDELTTEEALGLCEQLVDAGVKEVTFSGGEPFVRRDWKLLAKRLTDSGITVNAISNGWMLDERTIDSAIEAGLCNIGISLDGLEETHDFIRKKGSFSHVMSALNVMQSRGMPSAIVTCINTKNMAELPQLRDLLIEKGVEIWQLQIAVPMGNLLDHRELILKPEEMSLIVDFAYETAKDGKIAVEIADGLGYYDLKIEDIKKICRAEGEKDRLWGGCQAGRCGLGIRCNGDVSACLSIRDDRYIEGNIRKTMLKDIWTRPGAFALTRSDDISNLTGFCRECRFAELCRAGCTTARLALSGSETENEYCIYRVEMEKILAAIEKSDDLDGLIEQARILVEDAEFKIAERSIEKALKISPDNVGALELAGYIEYELKNYDECRRMNERALGLSPENPYALKGLGLAMARTGDAERGIENLRRAVSLADVDVDDFRYDLALTLAENARSEEAIEALGPAVDAPGELGERARELMKGLKAEPGH